MKLSDEMCRSRKTWEPSTVCPDCGRNLGSWVVYTSVGAHGIRGWLLPKHRKPAEEMSGRSDDTVNLGKGRQPSPARPSPIGATS